MNVLWIALGLVAAVFSAAGLWRFVAVRKTGTQALMRALPAESVHGWRHGIVRYSGSRMTFYMLRSLSFGADVVLSRNAIHVTGRREATETEREFMPGVEVVLIFSADGREYEFACDQHTGMALVSWLESAPDRRQVRTDMNDLHHRAFRTNQ
ncbi:DUF2550 domain-containing protein [Corynebacterium sp. MSK044]|uniref:DUF2550 domain-containing protein n=1 Tax=unclassified Corynebacterium TaxID=2624378 RepID=UPI00254A08AD|nr:MULTISPECIES: DUF2550 domain-containing protein [unclassified Corynebacterium]MDK8794738.1 DUF2550 domain-containing protein [Corynebacterium sp. MSK041]MDK8797472.1 DUF2550 domain-containing protein [Corynebacterium sp. MSK044]